MSRPYNGTIGGVTVEDGKPEGGALTPAIRGYADRHGLRIEDGRLVIPDTDTPEPPDPREVTHQHVGAPLRDAAVDPRSDDYLPPTNAGKANPHGPEVIAPEVHGREVPSPIVPGDVPDDPDEQETKQTVAASAAAGTPLEAPAGNASTDEWRTYALSLDGVTEADVDGLSRNELRDKYGS